MDDKVILAGVKIDEPFLYSCVLDQPMTCGNKSGVNFELFDAVMTALGLKYKLVPAEENDAGYKDGNGIWRGLKGQLMRKEIDMTASLIDMAVESDNSLPDLEYSAPATYFVKAFLIQKPDADEATVSPWFLATTFKPLVWLCFFSVLISYVFLLFGARMLAVSKNRRRAFDYLCDSIEDVVRGPLSQTEPWPYITPLRLTLNYMNVPVFILMNFYTAYLTGSLMILGQPQDPFKGINDLSRLIYESKFTLIRLKSNVRAFDFLPNATYSDDPENLIDIASAWNPPVLASNISEAVAMVANNKSLVLRGSYQQIQHASASSCRTKLMEDRDSVPTILAYGFRRNDSLSNLVSRILYKSTNVERFLKSAYKKYLLPRQCDDDVTTKPKFFSLGLKQLKYGYFLLTYGFAVAIPVLFLEYLAPRIKKPIENYLKSKRLWPFGKKRSLRRHHGKSTSTRTSTNFLWNSQQLSPNPSVDQLFSVRRVSNVSSLGL